MRWYRHCADERPNTLCVCGLNQGSSYIKLLAPANAPLPICNPAWTGWSRASQAPIRFNVFRICMKWGDPSARSPSIRQLVICASANLIWSDSAIFICMAWCILMPALSAIAVNMWNAYIAHDISFRGRVSKFEIWILTNQIWKKKNFKTSLSVKQASHHPISEEKKQ